MDGENLFLQFERDNAPLAGTTEAILSGIVRDRPRHARFLNTLAMLEHMGSAKIMATQQGPAIDQPTLKHLAEESRHAFFFKRQAEREAGRALSGGADDLLAAPAARRYFQRLEAEILRALPAGADRRTPYLTMSMMVEFRAVWGYRIYQSVLDRAGHSLSLNSLLAEESGHLTDMAARLEEIGQFDRARIRTLWQVEQDLYRRLLAALAFLPPAFASTAAQMGADPIPG
jgi:hypothetical protein